MRNKAQDLRAVSRALLADAFLRLRLRLLITGRQNNGGVTTTAACDRGALLRALREQRSLWMLRESSALVCENAHTDF